MDSNQVLIDARVTGSDGIGRYTHNLVQALVALLPCLGIDALELLLRSNDLQQYSSYRQFDTSEHYTYAELQCLTDVAEQTTALLLHCTDYRVPLHLLNMPLVVSVHDIFRYTNPELCYSGTEFKDRYGDTRFGDVCRIVAELETKLGSTEERSTEKSGAVNPYHQRYYQLLLKWAIHCADVVLVPSHWVRAEIEKTFGTIGNIEVIPYGIDHQVGASTTRGDLSLERREPGYPYFVYVGQDRPHKNVGKLLEAFALLCQRDSQVKLVLVGKDFEQNQQVTSAVKRAGLQSRVILQGKVNDEELRAIYKQACALVHLAMFEGFGFTPLLAALICQTVQTFEVIITDDGSNDGTREMIERAMRHRLWQGRLRWVGCGPHTAVRTGRARNIGAANVSADCTFMIMLDSDVLLQQDAIALYAQAHEQHPEAVILGQVEWLPPMDTSQILNTLRRGGVTALRHLIPPGPPVRIEGTFVGPELRSEINKDLFSQNIDEFQPLRAEWFLTANLGIPLQTFWQVGGFDEYMQGYGYQDIEFGMRVQKSGVICALWSAVNAVHIWHKKEQAEKRMVENQRNLDYVLWKHGPHAFLETLIDWQYWWHYRAERRGQIISSMDQLWAVNAHGNRRLLLPSPEWVRRLGYKSEDILNDPDQEIIAQSTLCGEAVEIR